jgi:hypothetical protein
VADSSPSGDQPRAGGKDIVKNDMPSLNYRSTVKSSIKRTSRDSKRS